MSDSKQSKHIDELEDDFPTLAASVFHQKSEQALKRGLSVVQLRKGKLCRISLDGKPKVIRKIKAISVRKNQKITLT